MPPAKMSTRTRNVNTASPPFRGVRFRADPTILLWDDPAGQLKTNGLGISRPRSSSSGTDGEFSCQMPPFGQQRILSR